ncbi:MAG TPA: YihY/virulence factor BrkB family protein [Acidobacteriota bacterium]|nr:YihY/virulence factor BrkB family protein [Acidobacteriota bacterium]
MKWKPFQIESGQERKAILINACRAMAYNESPATAAAIAYFSLLSIFPLLVLIIVVCNNYFNLFDASSTAVRAVLRFFPGAQSFIRKSISSVKPSREIILSSAVVFTWTSFWLVALLENALNKAWQVRAPRHFLHSRLLALLMIAVGGSFLGASVALTTVLTVIQQKIDTYSFAHWATAAGLFWRITFGLTAFVLTLAVFTLIYKMVPNIHVHVGEALTAGIIAGTLWQIAAYVFAVVVRHLDYDAIYGSVGAIVALLSWVYLSSYIFLFGAHLSAQMHRFFPKTESEAELPAAIPLKGS